MANSEPIPPAYLTMTNVDPQEWCAPFTAERKVIGRGVQADIRIPQRHALVSRKHAEIWAELEVLKILDLGSKSGTHINGVWLTKEAPATLVGGDRIWMGGIEFEVVAQVPLLAQVLAETGHPGTDDEEVLSNENTDVKQPEGVSDPLARSTEFGLKAHPTPFRMLLAELSQAELQVVLWMGRGYLDDGELAEKLHRSPNTIRTHVNSIFRKLNLHSRGEVVGYLKRGR